jgi:phosphohistidine phosphatase SixA
MKNTKQYLFILITLIFITCKKDSVTPDETKLFKITSAEFKDDLLFVNTNDYQIKTSEPATFSSNDPNIEISTTGLIKKITSGEVVSIDVTVTASGTKAKLWAVGATDNNHLSPFATYHAAEATDPYNQYIKGWQTLRKLPVATETYAIVLRHADADNGSDFSESTGPANWWISCDPKVARQLNEQGIARATELGKIFKNLQFPITRVISSEFCRAKMTAELINAGPEIKRDGRLNHPAYNTSGKTLFRNLRDILLEEGSVDDNKITLISTHHPINEFGNSGIPTFPEVSAFNWTGAFFVKIAADKTITYEGAASWGMFKYWRDLKRGI